MKPSLLKLYKIPRGLIIAQLLIAVYIIFPGTLSWLALNMSLAAKPGTLTELVALNNAAPVNLKKPAH